MEERIDLARLILPSEVCDSFEIVSVKAGAETLDIYLDEKPISPAEGSISKGFREARTIKDFPLRGKSVNLHIRRRKWQLPDGQIYSKTYDLTHLGTQITKEFAAFLKEAYRVYNAQY